MLDSERLNGFPLKLGDGETRLSTINILNIVLEVLASAIDKKRK